MRNFDFFKHYPVMTINREEGMKTTVGAVFSIFIVITIIIAIIINGNDLLNKYNPQITIIDSINKQMEASANDTIALGVTDKYGNKIKNINQYFNITFGTVYFNSTDTKENIVYKTYKSVNCFELYKDKDSSKIIKFLTLDKRDYFCANNNLVLNKTESNILNTFGDSNFNAWDIRVSFCNNGTDIICKSKEEILNEFKNFYAVVVIKNTIIDNSNYSNPITYSYKSILSRISTTSTRQDVFYLYRNQFASDSGFLLKNMFNEEFYTYLKFDTDYILDISNFDYVYRLILTLSDNMKRIERYYDKIQNIASKIGGLMQFLLITCSIISSSFSKVSFLQYVSNMMIMNQNAYYINWEEIVKNLEMKKIVKENTKKNTMSSFNKKEKRNSYSCNSNVHKNSRGDLKSISSNNIKIFGKEYIEDNKSVDADKINSHNIIKMIKYNNESESNNYFINNFNIQNKIQDDCDSNYSKSLINNNLLISSEIKNLNTKYFENEACINNNGLKLSPKNRLNASLLLLKNNLNLDNKNKKDISDNKTEVYNNISNLMPKYKNYSLQSYTEYNWCENRNLEKNRDKTTINKYRKSLFDNSIKLDDDRSIFSIINNNIHDDNNNKRTNNRLILHNNSFNSYINSRKIQIDHFNKNDNPSININSRNRHKDKINNNSSFDSKNVMEKNEISTNKKCIFKNIQEDLQFVDRRLESDKIKNTLIEMKINKNIVPSKI